MSFCTTFFHLRFLACFWGVKQTNRYLSVAFSGLKTGTKFSFKTCFPAPVHHRKERCFCLSFANAKLAKIFRTGKNTGFTCGLRGFFPYSAIFFMPFICSLYNNFAIKGIGYESGKCKGVVLPEKERGGCWKSHATLTPLAKQDGPLWLQYDCPFKVLVLGVNFILPF